MSLSPGTRLGHYDVTALLGEGGMGQVWQATDTQLNRQVALKILPDAFATDPDRLARFKREAQILASLNHPNIAAIHGIEEAEGTRALVLELMGFWARRDTAEPRVRIEADRAQAVHFSGGNGVQRMRQSAERVVTGRLPPPPAVGGVPLLGNIPEYFRNTEAFLWRSYEKCGHIFSIRLGPKRAALLIGPEYYASRPRRTSVFVVTLTSPAGSLLMPTGRACLSTSSLP